MYQCRASLDRCNVYAPSETWAYGSVFIVSVWRHLKGIYIKRPVSWHSSGEPPNMPVWRG